MVHKPLAPRIIMLTIACRDVGQPCDCVLSGRETKEDLLKKAVEHAVTDHGYKEEEIMIE